MWHWTNVHVNLSNPIMALQLKSVLNIPITIRLIQKRFIHPSRCLLDAADDKKPVITDEKTAEAERVRGQLMQFFDDPKNWDKDEVRCGRSWRQDELRIKSNADLHKLWYILLKERNMLLTMEEAAKEEVENMASPERIEKVEDSMKNIEEVIKERNKAYWELEVGSPEFATTRKAFRRDIFGRWRWIACNEHLIPYWMNSGWRKMNAPGFGSDVQDFNRKLREIKMNKTMSKQLKQKIYCRNLIKRFPNIDLDYLKEKFPHVDVHELKANLREHELEGRTTRFHSIFYEKKNDLP